MTIRCNIHYARDGRRCTRIAGHDGGPSYTGGTWCIVCHERRPCQFQLVCREHGGTGREVSRGKPLSLCLTSPRRQLERKRRPVIKECAVRLRGEGKIP